MLNPPTNSTNQTTPVLGLDITSIQLREFDEPQSTAPRPRPQPSLLPPQAQWHPQSPSQCFAGHPRSSSAPRAPLLLHPGSRPPRPSQPPQPATLPPPALHRRNSDSRARSAGTRARPLRLIRRVSSSCSPRWRGACTLCWSSFSDRRKLPTPGCHWCRRCGRDGLRVRILMVWGADIRFTTLSRRDRSHRGSVESTL